MRSTLLSYPHPWTDFALIYYCLHLLIRLDIDETNHSKRLPAMGSEKPLVIEDANPASESGLGL
ncbi:hypothetical protein E4L95_15070 [Paracoccus liaowanqingii]|uniref:Uncharacterized protein n=1 Tax=Paracoccus liaowanqingii TaxID=2560053 RepID=A0A4Z1CEZ8_9RHOB|nr:hypothetical protein [Paracoccus liaowanqingii]TGN55389.1 hypothetical protein E4L95_15070 [Paracoccus liaowanqingii]